MANGGPSLSRFPFSLRLRTSVEIDFRQFRKAIAHNHMISSNWTASFHSVAINLCGWCLTEITCLMVFVCLNKVTKYASTSAFVFARQKKSRFPMCAPNFERCAVACEFQVNFSSQPQPQAASATAIFRTKAVSLDKYSFSFECAHRSLTHPWQRLTAFDSFLSSNNRAV